MKITKIHVKNYKSFKDETIEFDKLNILIGANASGKSNTISLFRFINQIIEYGIENAISLSGGIEYVLNTNIGKKEPLSLSFSYDCTEREWVRSIGAKNNNVILAGYDCDFEITPHKRGSGFTITKDIIVFKYYQVNKTNKDGSIKYDVQKYYHEEFKRTNRKFVENVVNKTDFEELQKNKEAITSKFVVDYLNNSRAKNNELLLHFISLFLPYDFRYNELVHIYDFDPKLMKKSASLTSISHLEEDGSNLANILQGLLKNSQNKNKLINYLSDSLPFVKSITTERNFDKSVSYKIKEIYSKKELYANFLSDGTVSMLAIIIALNFERSLGTIILEEPERNLHPALMSKVIEMAKETSTKRQIIITTHTPELIKYADEESILLASRCSEGYTCIKKPINDDEVKVFIQNEIGIDKLFAQNMI